MIEKILISDDLIEYIELRKLSNQYLKAKNYILNWNFKAVNFKIREPKKDKIYYFRINKQFRALALLEDNVLKIFDIDNHQR